MLSQCVSFTSSSWHRNMASGARGSPDQGLGQGDGAITTTRDRSRTPTATTPTVARRLRLEATLRDAMADAQRGRVPSSPAAKRPRAPRARPSPAQTSAPEGEPPDARSLQRQIDGLKTDLGHEVSWGDDMHAIADNHAKLINAHTGQLDQVHRTLGEFKENLNSMVSQMIQNDEFVKTSVANNDVKLKEAVEGIYGNLKRVEGEVHQHGEIIKGNSEFREEVIAMKKRLETQQNSIDVHGDLISGISAHASQHPPGLVAAPGDARSSRFTLEAEIRLGRGLDMLQKSHENLEVRMRQVENIDARTRDLELGLTQSQHGMTQLDHGMKQVRDAIVNIDSFAFTRTATSATAPSGNQDFPQGHHGQDGDVAGRLREAQAVAAAARRSSQPHSERYDIHSSGGEVATNPTRIFFDDKLAQNDVFKYRSGGRQTWANGVRNFFIGRCSDARVFLRWAEDRGLQRIFLEDIRQADGLSMVDVDVMELSQKIWAWLQLNLQGVDNMQNLFDNVEPLNGAELWRKLVVPINLRSPEQRHILHGKVRNPAKARKFEGVIEKIEDWESDMRKFADAKGKPMDEEDQIIITLSMLPPEVPFSLVSELRKIPSFAELKARLEQEVEYFKNGANKLSVGKQMLVAEDGKGDDEMKMANELLMILNRDDVDEDERAEEIMAFMKKRASGRFVPKQKLRPGGRRPRDRREAPPRGVEEVRCQNCGKKGHDKTQCRERRVALTERPCWNCNEVGHVKAKCPLLTKGKPAHAVEGDKAAGASYSMMYSLMTKDTSLRRIITIT